MIMIVSVLYSSSKPPTDSMCLDVGRAIANAGHDLLVMPGDGMPKITRAYKDAGGLKVVMLFPDADDFGTEHVDKYRHLADDLVVGMSWAEANCEITKRSDIVVVTGMGPGALIELGFIKYNFSFFKKPQKLVLLKGIELPSILEECYKEIGLPVDRVASASELFL